MAEQYAPFNRHQQPPFGVRMPLAMLDEIKRIAKANGRSANAEIVKRIAQTLGPEFTAMQIDEEPQMAKDLRAIRELLERRLGAKGMP